MTRLLLASVAICLTVLTVAPLPDDLPPDSRDRAIIVRGLP